MMHFHQFGRWEDVDVTDNRKHVGYGLVVVTHVIKQQRRCKVCNLVKTRTA